MGTTNATQLGEQATGDQGAVRAAHTPGPWEARHETGNWKVVAPTVAKPKSAWGYTAIASNVGGISEHREGNARLIAAAPEMLEALEAVLSVADRKTDEFDRARAAIAKATASAA